MNTALKLYKTQIFSLWTRYDELKNGLFLLLTIIDILKEGLTTAPLGVWNLGARINLGASLKLVLDDLEN